MYAEIIRKAYNDGKRAFAIRALADDEKYSVGDNCRESYDWDFENDCSAYVTTGTKAGGTCGVKIACWDCYFDGSDDEEIESAVSESIEKAKEYGLDLIIIAGDLDVCCDYSVDNADEARLTNASVIAVIE
jgi:hypothetical protein